MAGRDDLERGRRTGGPSRRGRDELLHDPPRGPRFGPPARQPYDADAADLSDGDDVYDDLDLDRGPDRSPAPGLGAATASPRRRARRRPSAGRRSPRLLIALAAIVLLVVGVAVFLVMRGDDEPPAAFSLGDASANAVRAKRIAYDVSVRLDGALVTSASAVVEPQTGSQQITETAGGPSGTTPNDELSGFVYDASIGAVYLDSDAFAPMGLRLERPYVRIDLDELADGVELDPAELLARYGGSPMPIVELLGATAAQDLGAETLAGEAVEHFRAELSLAELLAADPDLRALMRVGVAAAASSSSSGSPTSSERPRPTPTPVPTPRDSAAGTIDVGTAATGSVAAGGGPLDGTVVADVFVTERNELRQIVLAPSVRGAAVVTLSFTEYDGTTAVTAPPEEQVIALADAFGR